MPGLIDAHTHFMLNGKGASDIENNQTWEDIALTGKVINPYPWGKIGVIEEGAYADILVVDGNPLEDLSVIGANSKWFDAEYRPNGVESIKVIMKDGVIYKNIVVDPSDPSYLPIPVGFRID